MRLMRDGEPLPSRRRKELLLLAFLDRHGRRWFDRAALASWIWPGSDEDRARQSLRQALSALRSIDPQLIDSEPERVRRGGTALAFDLRELEQAGHPPDATALQSLLQQGACFGGFDDEVAGAVRSWMDAERAMVARVEQALRTTPVAQARARSDLTLSPSPYGAHAREAGRADSRACPEVEAHLAPLLEGGGSAIVRIEGDRGSGRSTLLAAIEHVVNARVPEVCIVRLRVTPPDAADAWRVLIERLVDAPGAVGTDPVTLAMLARVAPAMRETMRGLPAGESLTSSERAAVVSGGAFASALIALLRTVASEQPLLLLIDNADRFDAPQLATLATIAGAQLPGLGLVVSGTPGSLTTLPDGALVVLAPLSAAELQALIRQRWPHFDEATSLAEAILAQTDALPGTVMPLLAQLEETGRVTVTAEGRTVASAPFGTQPLPIPEATRDRVRETVAQLTPEARLLAERLAILDGAIPVGLAEAVFDEQSGSFRAALSALVRRRLLQSADGRADAYVWSSPVWPRHLLEEVPRTVRERTHRRALAWWHAAPASHPARARHLAWHRAQLAVVATTGARAPWTRPPYAIGVAAMLLLALSAASWWRARVEVPPQTAVILADVVNATRDTATARALEVAAFAELQGSGHVWAWSRSEVTPVLQRMRVPGADTAALTEPRAREVALREAVPLVLVYGLASAGSRYQLSLRIVESSTARSRFTRATTTSGDSLLPSLVHITRDALHALGTSRVAEQVGDTLPRVSTRSLPALQAYAMAARAWGRGDYLAARTSFDEAVTLDSTFATAWADYARYHFYTGNDPISARAAAEVAQRHARSISPYERLAVAAAHADVHGDLVRAEALARTRAERWPSPSSLGTLGYLYLRNGRCADAVPLFRRALALKPNTLTHLINLATCLPADTASTSLPVRLTEALALYERAESLDSAAVVRMGIAHEIGFREIQVGKVSAARRRFERLTASDEAGIRARALRSLGMLHAYEGRVGDAEAMLSKAVPGFSNSYSEARTQLMLAEVRTAAGDARGAGSAFSRVMQLSEQSAFEPLHYAQLAVCAALAGDATVARRAAARFEAVAPASPALRPWRLLVEAVRRYADGDAGAALDRLALLDWTRNVAAPFADGLRLRLLEVSGRTDDARRTAATLRRTFSWGNVGQMIWLGADSLVGALRFGRNLPVQPRTFMAGVPTGDRRLPVKASAQDR